MRIIMWTLKLLDTESCTALTANNNVYMCIICVCVASIPSFVSNYTIIRSSYYNRANILQAVTSKADI